MNIEDLDGVDLTRGIYRRIYGGATKGRRINSVSMLAELLFWRLHCVADDYGAFDADPYLLRIVALPLRQEVTDALVARSLDELESAALVRLYSIGRDRYGVIANFTELQPANRNGKR